MLSDLELRLKPGSNLDAVKAEMQQIACLLYASSTDTEIWTYSNLSNTYHHTMHHAGL